MPYINNKTRYGQDLEVSRKDFLIGSDYLGDTKTFTIGSILDKFVEEYEGIGIVMKYSENNGDESNEGYFTSNDEDLSLVTTININKFSVSGVDISSKLSTILAQIGNTSVLLKIEDTSDINTYAYYDITQVVDNTTYYTITTVVTNNLVNGTLTNLNNYYLRFEISIGEANKPKSDDETLNDTDIIATTVATANLDSKINAVEVTANQGVTDANTALTVANVAQADVDALEGAIIFQGDWDISGGVLPTGFTVSKGFQYKIINGSQTIDSVTYNTGDFIDATQNNPSDTLASSWNKKSGQGVGGSGITYQDITITALTVESGVNRLSQEYYNVTDADTNNGNIIYGKIRFLTETQFIQDSTGIVYSI